jgi:hypothetical protein
MFSWLKTKNHKCPDGTTKTVYRNVDDAFPFFLPGIKTKVGGDVNVPATVSVGVKAEYEEKALGLLVKLDDWNNSLMMSFRAAYVVYQGDPCSSYGYLQREVSGIMRKHELIQRIRLQIDGLLTLVKNSGGKNLTQVLKSEFFVMYRGILEQMGSPVAREAAIAEIHDATQHAQKWIGEANDS